MGFEDRERSCSWLQGVYSRRRARNPAYSLRAFSRQIGVASGALSEIFSGRRALTLKTTQRIAQRLGLNALEIGEIPDRSAAAGHRPLGEDVFALIADWYHYAILSLLQTPLRSHSSVFLARRLGISPVQARSAVERMLRIGLLKRERGRLKPTGSFTTSQDVPSSAIRRFHRQVLARAASALDTVSVQERDISCVTLAVDRSRLLEAKRRIVEFRRSLADLLESGRPTEVYHLSISLFPAKGGTS